MMETPNLWEGYDLALVRRLDRAAVWRVPSQGEMAPGAMVVGQVRPEDSAQVPLVEYDDVVQALAPDRADDPFDIGILPRGAGRREHLADPQAVDPPAER